MNHIFHVAASNYDEIPFRVVSVANVKGPSFKSESSTWTAKNQELFKRSWESLAELGEQRQWILLRVHAAEYYGMLTFFIFIEGAKYILIYDKIKFAQQLGIMD
jgi:hypothetical protein